MPNKLKVPAMWSQQMGAVVAKQNELAAGVYSSGQTFEQMREGYRKERVFWNDGGPVSASTIEEDVATRHGRVRVRMHRPDSAAILPGIVYVHGGGWVLGDLDTHDRITRTLAEKTGAAVIAVDYTLSPEARFPRALEECVDVVLALKADADKWGSILGDSPWRATPGAPALPSERSYTCATRKKRPKALPRSCCSTALSGCGTQCRCGCSEANGMV